MGRIVLFCPSHKTHSWDRVRELLAFLFCFVFSETKVPLYSYYTGWSTSAASPVFLLYFKRGYYTGWSTSAASPVFLLYFKRGLGGGDK